MKRAVSAVRAVRRTHDVRRFGLVSWVIFAGTVVMLGGLASQLPTSRELRCSRQGEHSRCVLVETTFWVRRTTRPISRVSAHEHVVGDELDQPQLLLEGPGGPTWIHEGAHSMVIAQHVADNMLDRDAGPIVEPLSTWWILPASLVGAALVVLACAPFLRWGRRLVADVSGNTLRVIALPSRKLVVGEFVLSKLRVSKIKEVGDTEWCELVLKQGKKRAAIVGARETCERARAWIVEAVREAGATSHGKLSGPS